MVSLDIVPYAELDTECGTADPFDSGGQDRAAPLRMAISLRASLPATPPETSPRLSPTQCGARRKLPQAWDGWQSPRLASESSSTLPPGWRLRNRGDASRRPVAENAAPANSLPPVAPARSARRPDASS